MPRFWTRLVDSLPRESKNLTWRVPLVFAVIVLALLIFLPFQDTPYAEMVVHDTYDKRRRKIDEDAREVVSYKVTNRWVWLTSRFHYSVEREMAANDIEAKDGRPRKERTLQIRSRGLNLGLDLRGGTELLYRIIHGEKAKAAATAKDIKRVIQKRIDAAGLREPRIQAQGTSRLLVQLPGQEATALASIKRIIENTGRLEFRLVASEKSEPRKAHLKTGKAPAGYHEYNVRSLKEDRFIDEKILIRDKVEMTGEHISGTRVSTAGSGATLGPSVILSFDPLGQQKFTALTGANVDERLAIILNTVRAEGKIIRKGTCYSAPVIRSKIFGDAEISGDFSMKEANELRTVLMAGSLPAPLQLEHENTVGPSLGPALISKGIRAIAIGLTAVLGFMMLYYWLAGLIANFALFLNILIVVAVMILFDATLTLPGIAGLLLTVGMSVDANVLIFERIREEKSGPTEKPLRLAIRDGYGRAFWTIFDANLTTLFTAMILYWRGTGPVKGFAIVLSIGILASMFTALVVTRVVFDVLTWRRIISRLRMGQLIRRPHIAFMSVRNKMFLASAVLVAAGLSVFIARGEDNWDIDFRGGTLIHLVFREAVDADDITSRLLAAGPEFAGCEVQTIAPAAAEGARFPGRRARELVLRLPTLSEVTIPEIKTNPTVGPGALDVVVQLHVRKKREDVEQALKNAKVYGYTVRTSGTPDKAGASDTFQITAPLIHAKRVRKELTKGLAVFKSADHKSVFVSYEAGEPRINWGTEATARSDRPVSLAEIQGELEASGDLWQVEPKGAAEGEGRYRSFIIRSSLTNRAEVRARIQRAFSTQAFTAVVARIFKADLAPPGIETLGRKDGRTAVAINLTRAIPLATVEAKLTKWGLDAKAAADPASASDGEARRFRIDVASNEAEALDTQVREDVETFPLSDPIPRVAKVGPAVAHEMLVWAVVAIAAASAIIIAYVWLRFERLKYGMAAVAALIHDVLITMGLLSILGCNFNLPIVAALLTIIGYSINDTIVVFDRIRENLRRERKRDVDAEIINTSINQVLGRTLLTSMTTLLAVVSLYLFGGGVIQDFALALLIGVVVGTYSSIFIASPLLIVHQEQIVRRLGRGRKARA